MAKEIKDARSTGRKRGRRVLEKTGRPYQCQCAEEHDWHLGTTTCKYTPQKQGRADTLDVNHINKNIMDNDPANLEWLCRRCHKAIDSKTAKGEMSEEAKDALYGGMLNDYGL